MVLKYNILFLFLIILILCLFYFPYISPKIKDLIDCIFFYKRSPIIHNNISQYYSLHGIVVSCAWLGLRCYCKAPCIYAIPPNPFSDSTLSIVDPAQWPSLGYRHQLLHHKSYRRCLKIPPLLLGILVRWN